MHVSGALQDLKPIVGNSLRAQGRDGFTINFAMPSTNTGVTVMKNLNTLIAIGLSAFVSCAQASNTTDEASVVVKYSVRDLARERGPATLYAKIEAAAASLCQNYTFGHSPAQLTPYQKCVGALVGRTLAMVDRPELSSYAAARGVPVAALSAARIRE